MQLVADKPVTDTIRAKMNYIIDTGVPPVNYVDWPEMAHKANPPTYKMEEVTIRNGRPLRDTFKLDTHGFAFVDHVTRVNDFTDEAERRQVYDPEVAALIGKVTQHWFRHRLATLMLRRDPRAAMEQGGWRDIRSVTRLQPRRAGIPAPDRRREMDDLTPHLKRSRKQGER